MRSVEQGRYEAVFKALARPAWIAILLCIVASVVAAFVVGVVFGFVRSDLPPDWPQWLTFAVFFVPLAITVMVVGTLAQLIVIRGDTARAIEAVNAWGLGEVAEYTARTGKRPPTNAFGLSSMRRWLSKGEGHGTRLRMRVLIWSGELNAAAEVIAALPTGTPVETFHRSLLRELLEFVATGSMDLAEPRAELERIPQSPDRDQAVLALALEESRLEHAAGRDPWAPLARARDQVSDLPKGASIRDRIVAGLPTSAGLFVVIGAVLWFVMFS